jgi:hypothetical protein
MPRRAGFYVRRSSSLIYKRSLADGSALRASTLFFIVDEAAGADSTMNGAQLGYDSTSFESEVNREASDAAETIVHAVFRRKGSLLSVEAGAEGTINTLDSHIALTEDGAAVALPAADVRVEEQRSELFTTATWQLTSALIAETGLLLERRGCGRHPPRLPDCRL